MEDVQEIIEEPIQFSKGINLRELLTSDTEFQIDLDFKQKKSLDPNLNDELFQLYDEEEESSDCEDILKTIEDSAEKQMLSSPELHALVAPSLAWGPMGVPPRIRPETALFVIALYKVTDRRAPDTTVNSLHAEAKDLFRKKKYRPAMKNYQQAMSVLNISRPETEIEEAEIKRLRINTYVNLAMCYCKLNKPNYAISMLENLEYVTDTDKHCKALFYYGKAYQMLGNNEEALKYYRKSLKLEPKNKDIGKTLAELDEYIKKSAVKEKELWQNAFESEPAKKESVYDVDEDFQNGVRDMCQDLAGRHEYVKFDLPLGLTKDEVGCIRSMITEFKGLTLVEDGEGKRKKVLKMLRLLFFAAFLQCSISQQYQQKVAPGVPPQNYQQPGYQQAPPPPPPQQYQQPPPPQQQQVNVQQHGGHGHHGDPQLLNPANIAHERDHIQEHMDVPIDTSKMSEQELQFHYFKMHDADNNNKLDGCELIKSLIHWHEQGHKQPTQEGAPPVGEKIFADDELVNLIDPILNMDDHNRDGYIDYPEFAYQNGPGHVRLRLETGFGPVLISQSVTPIGVLQQRVVHRIYSPWYNAVIAAAFVPGESYMFERDITMWNNKRYISSPIYVKTDKSIRAFRAWYSQFYSEKSVSFKDATQNPLDW
ncbi:hypothetical protein MSG28_016217 [Choristoneura fumiferana]|uniref:Uncharacterized protein n=1 Tax=Choristoneura fumiferana TaxID=7141 RepID=A0ACC0K5Q6_CHOFU|nr:hypothetical protein MSG28_016217 [Choristoneura fumiferana]